MQADLVNSFSALQSPLPAASKLCSSQNFLLAALAQSAAKKIHSIVSVMIPGGKEIPVWWNID